MLDSTYHMTLNYLSYRVFFGVKTSRFYLKYAAIDLTLHLPENL